MLQPPLHASAYEKPTFPGLQTFSFSCLTPPPVFLQSVLPRRLAQIRNIQICYNSPTISLLCASEGNDRRAALHAHRMHRCAACNLYTWSKLIKQNLKGLRKIELFIYLGETFQMPAPDAPWIASLLEWQYGANGLREIKINILPVPCMTANPVRYLANAPRLDSLLQSLIKKGAEKHKLED